MSSTASLTCVDGWTPPTSPAPVSRPALLTASRSTDQPSSGVATRPSYSLQVNIGRLREGRSHSRRGRAAKSGRMVWRREATPALQQDLQTEAGTPAYYPGDRQDHRPSLLSAGPTNDPRQMSFSGHRATFHGRGTLQVGWGELPYDHR